jgi:hypothetical protein
MGRKLEKTGLELCGSSSVCQEDEKHMANEVYCNSLGSNLSTTPMNNIVFSTCHQYRVKYYL